MRGSGSEGDPGEDGGGREGGQRQDVQAVAHGVLSHRLIVRPEAEVEGKRAADIIDDLLTSVPVLETK